MGWFKFAGVALVSLGLLGACATDNKGAIIAADDATGDTNGEAQAGAEDVVSKELPSLIFAWSLGEAILIAPSITTQRDAIEACRIRGYDTSYMINVGIDGNLAIGEFGCRGAD